MSYRAGYLAEERRAIEEQMSDARCRHHRHLARTRRRHRRPRCLRDQRVPRHDRIHVATGGARRATQRKRRAVAGDDQLDYLMRHPHEVFERQPEPSVINTANPTSSPASRMCGLRTAVVRRLHWWNDEELTTASVIWSATAGCGCSDGDRRRTIRLVRPGYPSRHRPAFGSSSGPIIDHHRAPHRHRR